jgi:cobalamin biosynthesis protein CobD/CbiB
MIGDTTEKILDRYGFLGALTLMLALVVLILVWIAASVIYPVAFLTPVLIAIWMVLRVKGQDNE